MYFIIYISYYQVNMVIIYSNYCMHVQSILADLSHIPIKNGYI